VQEITKSLTEKSVIRDALHMSNIPLLSRVRNAYRAFLDTQWVLVSKLNALLAAQDASVAAVEARLSAHTAAVEARLSAHTHALQAAARGEFIDAVYAADGRYADPRSLARHNRGVYSQLGEDGVVAEIFRRIGTRDRTFVEIGIGDGRENTSRLFLETGWKGIWIEGSDSNIEMANKYFGEYVSNGSLIIINAFVTAENINKILDDAAAPEKIDYLSLDVDFNTAYIWAALNRRARVTCIEFNGHLPLNLDIRVPYIPDQVWDGGVWFGASLKAMENIGIAKEMSLVGCDLMGVNAFFVARDEAAGKFREPFDAETHYEPMRVIPFGLPHNFAGNSPRPWVVSE
jgi:hypothetical protein